jgi:hypothetical protein
MDRVRLIALWNDKNKLQTHHDAHLVQHMVELMRDIGGQVEIINPAMVAPRRVKADIDKATKSQEKRPAAPAKRSKKQE